MNEPLCQQTNESFSYVPMDDFVRRFGSRNQSLMWLLGAGASASSGIPTAWDIIWELKQKLYVTQRQVSPKVVADLSNPSVRARLQQHIDEKGKLPRQGAPSEYAALFEAVYPSESDRRTYIDGKIKGGKPSFGHIALATLMKAGLSRIIWTTNFDPMVTDACARVFQGTGDLTDIGLDAPELGREVLNEERWPAQIKLHGDFRSSRLKNTESELRQQDATMRELLVKSCERYGLVVVGYSGRDESIMDTLEEILEGASPFPAGLFWLHRGTDNTLPRVASLLKKAAKKGVDGGLVDIENFDEILRDLIRPLEGLDTRTLDEIAAERPVRTAVPRTIGKGGYPIIRLNALRLKSRPNICRLIRCSIGGTANVQKAIREAGVRIIASRRNIGVIAFGEDAEMHKVFDTYGIDHFGVHTIDDHGLRFDSQERGLLSDALSKALARTHGLRLERRRAQYLLSPLDSKDACWRPLREITKTLEGGVPSHPEIRWREGIGTRLEWANEHLWLLIEPRILFDGVTESTKYVASSFSRERTVRRFNSNLNDLVEFWSSLFLNRGNPFSALGVSNGLDAEFQFGERTAYSKRART